MDGMYIILMSQFRIFKEVYIDMHNYFMMRVYYYDHSMIYKVLVYIM